MSKVPATTQPNQQLASLTDPHQQSTTARGVQVQVLATQAQTATNGTLTQGITSQEIHTQISQGISTLQLTAEQQRLLQLYSQQLHKTTNTMASSLVTNAPLMLQSGATLQVVSTATPSTSSTAKSTGQYPAQYPDGGVVAQPSMMQPPLQTTTMPYYDPLSHHNLSHLGMHHGDHGGPITHSTRAHPQTIQWLLDNYETAEGVSLPRSTLYNHYLRHCAATKIDAVNAASFGKLIRSVFIGLKTRRLGTRGNSKYHYYGIRIKPDSPLNTYPQEDSPVVPMRQPPQATQRAAFTRSCCSVCGRIPMRQPPQAAQRDYQSGEPTSDGTEGSSQTEPTPQQQHHQYLGGNRPELTPFPEIQWSGSPIPAEITTDDLSEFTALYREHCEAILDVVVNLQFQMVENLWYHFWAENDKSIEARTVDDEGDNQLPKDSLLLITANQPVIDYLNACDHILYQCIADFLISDVLRPIPGTLTQAIRNFAKNLEGWLTNSLQGYPTNVTNSKVSTVVAFSQTLRRYTSLNHLAQAARAVLQNSSQISQMLSDLNRVDFANVQEQASWVCECDESLVQRLEQDFKTTLQQQKSLEEWAAWLEGVVNTVLEAYEGGPQFSKAARQFLLKWSFYSSMVIRDLTLRSAASFGSFHLIRLLYDEYMFFLIEHKVAKAAGKTPIAIMTEFSGHSRGTLFDDLPLMPLTEHFQHEAPEEQEPPAKRQKF